MVGALVVTPLKCFKRAVEFMRDHEKAGIHQKAMEMSEPEAYVKSVKSGINVTSSSNTGLQSKIVRNQQLLRSVAVTKT